MCTLPAYYELLQVSPNADLDVIQAAYKRLAFKMHPDRRPGDPSACEQMKLLNEAYEVLSNPRKRKEYDLRRTQAPTSGVAKEQTSQDTAKGQRPGPPADKLFHGIWSSRTTRQVGGFVLVLALLVLVVWAISSRPNKPRYSSPVKVKGEQVRVAQFQQANIEAERIRACLYRGATLAELEQRIGHPDQIDAFFPGESIPEFSVRVRAEPGLAAVVRYLPYEVAGDPTLRYRVNILFAPDLLNWYVRSPD